MTNIARTKEGEYELTLDEAQVLVVFEALVKQYRNLRKEADQQRKHLMTKQEADKRWAEIKDAHHQGQIGPKAPWGVDDEEALLYMRSQIIDVLRTLSQDTELFPDSSWMKSL